MLRIMFWFISAENMISALQQMITRLEAHVDAKAEEFRDYTARATAASKSADKCSALAEGLKKLVG